MKNLIISIGLVSSLLLAQSALASDVSAQSDTAGKIPTITVVAQPGVANFEIYSLKKAELAIDASMEMMVNDYSKQVVNKNNSSLNNAAIVGTAI